MPLTAGGISAHERCGQECTARTSSLVPPADHRLLHRTRNLAERRVVAACPLRVDAERPLRCKPSPPRILVARCAWRVRLCVTLAAWPPVECAHSSGLAKFKTALVGQHHVQLNGLSRDHGVPALLCRERRNPVRGNPPPLVRWPVGSNFFLCSPALTQLCGLRKPPGNTI